MRCSLPSRAGPALRGFGDDVMESRFGVVGTAHWATTVHSIGLQRTPGARLVGVWGRDPGRTEALARARGVRAFAAFDDMLDAVDAVAFAVPPPVQEALAPRALAAGKHVLLEKPVATSARAADALAEAAERNGLAGIVFFARRFVPEVAEFLARHAPGDWHSAEAEIRAPTFAEGSPYLGSVWRRAEGAGIWDIGPHALSVLVPMLGPVLEARRLEAEDGFERFGTAHARGGRAIVRITLRARAGESRNIFRFRGPAGEASVPEPEIDRAANLARAAQALLASIRDPARGHPCDLRFGAETVRTLERIQPWPAGV
jgi:predicted dehydrogenase